MGGGGDVHAHAGGQISGGLYRGGTGQFQAGPAAQLQQRLAAIRAKRVAGKKKGKGAGARHASPKKTPADRAKAKTEARAATLGKLGIDTGAQAALSGLASGKQPDAQSLDRGGLLAAGLVEQSTTDDSYRLTQAGRSLLRAAGAGDAGRAGDIISGAREKLKTRTGKQAAARQKKQARAARVAKRAKAKAKPKAATKPPAARTAPIKPEPIAPKTAPVTPDTTAPIAPAIGRKRQTTKGTDMFDYAAINTNLLAHAEALAELLDDDGAIKAGARHSGSDNKLIQAIYDSAEDICELAEALGATVVDEADEGEDAGDMGESVGHEGAPVEGKAAEDTSEEQEVYGMVGDAVKALAGDEIGGYAVRFGSETEPDISHMRDYFTKDTQYWLSAWDKRPMLYHHAQDESTADAPVIGTWNKATVDDVGVFLSGQLDRAHKYHAAIKELVRRGVLRMSSDSAPHLVLRATKAGGVHEVRRWPILACSLTPVPAEPRLNPVELKAILAELGDVAIDDNPEATDGPARESADEQKAAEDERLRRLHSLSIELDLLQLEATIA